MTSNRMARPSGKISNRILLAPSNTSRNIIEFERVTLQIRTVPQEAVRQIEHVYFPDAGLLSLLSASSEASYPAMSASC